MKKLILSAMLLGSAAMAANAQANSVLVFGQLGYHSNKDANDNKTRSFNFNPGVGYQFDNHWTLGVTGSFATTRGKSGIANSEWNYTNTYGVGAFLRYTMPVSKIFVFYSQLEAGYQGQTWGVTNTEGSISANGFKASYTPAVGILIADGFALNLGFGGIDYTTMKTSGANGSNSSFNFTWGNQFDIGISRNIFCGKHRKHHGVKMNHGSNVDKEDMKDNEAED